MPTAKIKEKYIETVGRRKTSIARVRGEEATKNSILINNKDAESYFKIEDLRETALGSLREAKHPGKFKISVKVKGGGIASQAEAIRHGIARMLVSYDVAYRKVLKKAGHLKRDPRMKERRKFGLKKARKAAQWSKR